MGDRLATIDMGRKVQGHCCAPFRAAELCPLLNNVACDEASLRTKYGILIHPAVFETIDIGRKVGATVAVFLGGSWVPISQCGLGRGLPP